jgi:tRNA pseudouridine38-40 synthase
VSVKGSGRTDAGVHAFAQIANFRCDTKLSAQQIRDGLNAILPDDIVITDVEDVPLSFDAQKNAKGKHYRYYILNGRIPSALNRDRYWHLRPKLNLQKMRSAAKYLVGEHDFASFKASDGCAKTSVRKISSIKISRKKDYVIIDVKGAGFLKNMVRIIVGTLVNAGLLKIKPAEVGKILKSKDRTKAGKTALAKGLFLVKVDY